ncbi:MAG: hypothetical protein LBT78_07425 [Tannerella sp.]|jgi:predicted transposase YdaD|nr:hypothetical protein [Tannerella sp.]
MYGGAFTEEELAVYEEFLDAVHVKNTIIRASEAKGIEKGRNEGRDERNTENVLNLHVMNMSIGQIHQATTLPINQIKEIINRKRTFPVSI